MKFFSNNRVFVLGILGLCAIATISVMLGVDHASAHQSFGYMADAAGAAALDKKTIEDLATEVKSQFQKSYDAVKEIAEKALADAAKGITLSEGQKEKTDDALTKMNVLNEQLATLEQKVLEGAKGEKDKPKSMGEMFIGDEKVKSFLAQANPRGRIDLQTKATLTSLTTDAAGSVGDAINQTRLPGILPLPQRRMTVRDLLSQGQMDGSVLEYVKETGFTNSAGMVAEGEAKPQSDIKLDLVSTSAKVIAHYMKASRQVLSDVAQLRSIIDNRLLYGLAYKEETQLLSGDNTGQNLYGIIPQATAYSAPVALADLNIIDVLRLAMLQAALADYPATGPVMHPTEWAGIETTILEYVGFSEYDFQILKESIRDLDIS